MSLFVFARLRPDKHLPLSTALCYHFISCLFFFLFKCFHLSVFILYIKIPVPCSQCQELINYFSELLWFPVFCVYPGEFVGDVADPDRRLHGGEAGGFLLPGPRGQVLLEHGQLQQCHGVPGWTQV